MAELTIAQDEASDTVTVNGIRYSRVLFEEFAFGLRPGERVEFVKRENGVITLRRIDGVIPFGGKSQ